MKPLWSSLYTQKKPLSACVSGQRSSKSHALKNEIRSLEEFLFAISAHRQLEDQDIRSDFM